MGVPTARQRVRYRSERPQGMYPLREPRAGPVTLESLRAETLERLDRQDRVLRLLLTQAGIQIPDYFQEPAAADEEEQVDDQAGGDQAAD